MPYLANGSVDKLFAMNVVYFLDPLPKYLTELNRVLKPGGTLMFGCKFGAVPKDNDVFVNVDEETIVQQLKETGFDVTSERLKVSDSDPKQNYTELLCTKTK